MLTIKKIKHRYIKYVFYGILLLCSFAVVCENQVANPELLASAQKQESALIERYGLLAHPAWQQKCDALIQELELTRFKQCKLLQAPFANAYSLAHGHVIITAGLLKNIRNDDQLAHVLAHEHAHLALNHHQQAQELVNNPPIFFTKSRIKKFYRSMEQQADASADQLLEQLGRDPLQIQHYLKRVKQSGQEQSNDHQKLKDRIKSGQLPKEQIDNFWLGNDYFESG